MKYFRHIPDLPTPDLYPELQSMLEENKVYWHKDMDQICINSIPGQEHDIQFGAGSLVLDWDNAYEKYDDNGNCETVVPKKEIQSREEDFTELCTPFAGTAFETAFDELKQKYNIGRVRLFRSQPHMCLSWHKDGQPTIHYPLQTQDRCYMVIQDEVKHLYARAWWATDTTHKHTAFNGSKESRIHLVANVLDDYENL